MTKRVFGNLKRGDIIFGRGGVPRKVLRVKRINGVTYFITLRKLNKSMYPGNTTTYVMMDRDNFQRKPWRQYD